MPSYEGRNPYDADKARAYLEKMIEQGKNFKIAVQIPKRTGRQNRFFHAILGLIADYVGSDMETIKQQFVKQELCKDIFYQGETSIGSKSLSNWRSTRDLNSKEFSIMTERLIFFASSELGLYIPDPGEYLEIMDEDTTHDWSAVDQFIFHVSKLQENNQQYNIHQSE